MNSVGRKNGVDSVVMVVEVILVCSVLVVVWIGVDYFINVLTFGHLYNIFMIKNNYTVKCIL